VAGGQQFHMLEELGKNVPNAWLARFFTGDANTNHLFQ